jgi:gamma-glutamyltranspeptidase/glutathione hydrolase
LICCLIALSCGGVDVTRFYEQGVVVTVSPVASEVGREVLLRGGNAFDAAVAVGFTLAVTYPPAGNLGGGGFALVRDGQSGEIAALDFRETGPVAANQDLFLDKNGEVIANLSTRGALAAGVPGSVAGLFALWEKYGTLPWQELVTAAARLADTGFLVDAHLVGTFAKYDESLREFDETRELFLPGGAAPREGDRFVQPQLARSLYTIAGDGPTTFYTGAIADSIVACMQKYDGIISRADLEQYRPVWREPVHFTFDSLDVYSMPPPSSGGIIVGQILKLLEPYDFSKLTIDAPEYIHLFCEASRLAFADRAEHLGDPAFYTVPSGLLDTAYLAERRALISTDHAGNSAEIGPGNPARYESDATTHFSICDRDGNMVAVTTTLNAFFGSGLTVGGAGFLLNNEMDDFAVKPGYPNLWGLVGSEANAVGPNKRMLSSMSPTLILKEGRPFLILGSSGGAKIITVVAQAIIDFTRFGLSLQETVDHARFHHQWLPDQIYVEGGGYDVATIQRLIRYGHQVEERSPYGELEMVYIGPTGLMTGAADPRRGGSVAGCRGPLVH